MPFLTAAVDLTVLVPLATAFVAGFFAWYGKAWQVGKEADDKALQALRRYRDPLLRSAFDLQSRLYNIAAKEFLVRYWREGSEEEREYARLSTLWLFGQYLGWVEILRREVQYLDLGSRSANQELQRRLNQISAALATDAHGRDEFIIFRSDQRAIGEFMVIERPGQEEGRLDCLGYSEFSGRLAGLETGAGGESSPAEFSVVLGWADRSIHDFDKLGESGHPALHVRLARIQRGLVDLVDLLDEDRVRYPYLNLRGKLPQGESQEGDRDEIARFVWPWSEPWDQVDAWAGERRMRCCSETASEKRFRGRKGLLGRRLEVGVRHDEGFVTVKAGTVRSHDARPLDGSLRSRRPRRIVNDLLKRFERPLLQGEGTVFDRVYAWAFRRS